jgi:hypothetical protein
MKETLNMSGSRICFRCRRKAAEAEFTCTVLGIYSGVAPRTHGQNPDIIGDMFPAVMEMPAYQSRTSCGVMVQGCSLNNFFLRDTPAVAVMWRG